MKKLFIIIFIIIILAAAGFFYNSGGSSRFSSEGSVKTASLDPAAAKNDASDSAIAEISGYQYAQTYSSAKYGFTFKYPNGFEVVEFASGGSDDIIDSSDNGDKSDIILVQNLEKKVGLQMVISKICPESSAGNTKKDPSESCPGPLNLTREVIGLPLDQPLEDISVGGEAGASFIGNDPNFAGTSREIWFTHAGYLYQASSYEKFSGFVKGLTATWQWGR